MSRWAWEAVDLQGVTAAIFTPRQAVVTRNLNAPSTLQIVADAGQDDELSTTARRIRGWRTPNAGGDRVIRTVCKVGSIQASASANSIETLNINAYDGMGYLANLVLAYNEDIEQETPLQIVQYVLGLTAGQITASAADGAAGPPRDREYTRGKVVSELIQELAEVDDGFYYRCNPVADAVEWCEIEMLYPESGTDSDAVFGWGPGSVGNLASAQVDVSVPANSIQAFGAGDGDEQLFLEVFDSDSMFAFGTYQKVISHTSVDKQETLEQHARDALQTAEPRTFRVQVAPSVNNPGLYLPTPWEDFDVGDTVRLDLRGRSSALQYDGRARVTSFSVEIDANGVERLSNIDLETV